jgi:formylglycine-generating enzyme required for sulfatase activity
MLPKAAKQKGFVVWLGFFGLLAAVPCSSCMEGTNTQDAQTQAGDGSVKKDLCGKLPCESGTLPMESGSDRHAAADAGTVPGTYVALSAGSFTMGSPGAEACRGTNEDQHTVTITRGFEIQTTEVTQEQFKQVQGYAPSAAYACGMTCPVERVTWHEAVAYCNRLSTIRGLAACYTCTGASFQTSCSIKSSFAGSKLSSCPGYRLPSEAEWELAARAGTTTAYYSGANDSSACTAYDATLDDIAWYYQNAGSAIQRSQLKQKNKWGLYDTLGNAAEWVHDDYVESLGTAAVTDPVQAASSAYRSVRGGSFSSHPQDARSASRQSVLAASYSGKVGFRCVRSK